MGGEVSHGSKPWEMKYEAGSSTGDRDQENLSEMDRSTETDPLVPKKDLTWHHMFAFRSFFTELHESFGYKILVLLCSAQHINKGFGLDWASAAVPYMFKAYNVPAPQANVFGGVIGLPWAVKPMIGLLSDTVPLFGYNKAPYIVLTTVLATIALVSLALVPSTEMKIGVAVACVFAFNFQMSTVDLLVEAKYSEKIKADPQHGPSLLTCVWGGMTVGGIFAVAASGVALSHFSYHLVYGVAVVPCAIVLIPALLGYLQEEYVTEENLAKVRACFYEQGETCYLVLVMFSATVVLGITGMYLDTVANACVTIVVAVVVLVSFSIMLSPTIAKFNAFALIQTSISLSLSGASFYFYTDTPEQYPATSTSPGGPHFSKFFYNSVMGTTAALFSLVGIWMYGRLFSTWRYRRLFLFSNVMISILSLLDLVVFSRLNVKMGIPDTVFVLGASTVDSIVSMWQWMPQVVILSYMVPKGMESTMYALLAGCHNLGNTISANCGALLLHQLSVQPSGATGETAMFDKLWIASAISTALPLVFIFSFYWLIPDASQNEKFTDPESDSATAGSLWRQWRGRTD